MAAVSISAIDSNYDEELRKLFDEPSKGMDMQSASADTRTRSTKLYGLLTSLVRGKALSLVKSVSGSDGYEALRQMILSPNTYTRGLALLTAATSWPPFHISMPLQPQILKLEEVFEESRRSGTEIQDAVKAAILMRCVPGQLKTYWGTREHGLQLFEGAVHDMGSCTAALEQFGIQ